MSRPVSSEGDARDGESEDLRVLWLDDEDADRLISSLSSDTARAVLTALHEEPLTASELADRVDTSLQNARHHLGKLQEAGLVRVSDTKSSVKGREMNVYAPVDDALVVAIGPEDDKDGFFDSLKRLIGVAGVLALGSLLVQYAFGAGVVDLGGPATAPRVPDSVAATGGPVLGILPPGAAFLLGGLLVLGVVLAWDRLR